MGASSAGEKKARPCPAGWLAFPVSGQRHQQLLQKGFGVNLAAGLFLLDFLEQPPDDRPRLPGVFQEQGRRLLQ